MRWRQRRSAEVMIAETQAIAAKSDVFAAIRTASAKTGSDFDYLLGTAMRESSLKTDAKAKTSSATGLFQFLDQTWLGVIKRFGAQHGLSAQANAITQRADGRYVVADKEAKAAILALRKDAGVSAMMAGEAARETKEKLECSLGRDVGCGELYAAHFLGEGAAKKLLALNDSNPGAKADQFFPAAANANRNVFYHKDGSAKSVGEVYAWAVNMPNGAAAASAASGGAAMASVKSVLPQAVRDTADGEFKDLMPLFRREKLDVNAWRPAQNIRTNATKLAPEILETAGFMPMSSLPQAPFMMTPGIVQILASLSPLSQAGDARRQESRQS